MPLPPYEVKHAPQQFELDIFIACNQSTIQSSPQPWLHKHTTKQVQTKLPADSDSVSSDCVSSDCVSSDCMSSDCVSSDCMSSDCVSSDCMSSDCVSSDCVSSDCVSSDCVSSDCVPYVRVKAHTSSYISKYCLPYNTNTPTILEVPLLTALHMYDPGIGKYFLLVTTKTESRKI